MAEVTIQPSSKDTDISANNATTNYGSEINIRAGESDASTNNTRALIAFDLSTIPSYAIITSAKLNLYLYDDFASNIRIKRVYRLKRAWVEAQATWNIYSTGNNWSTAGAFGADDCEQTDIGSLQFTGVEADGWKEWELTPSAIQAMVTGAWTNNGFLIKADTENNDMHHFYSRNYAVDTSLRPKLIITYSQPKSNPQVIIF